MPAKKQDSTSALVTVVKALESLSDADKQWVLNSAASRWTLTVQAQSGGGGAGAGGGGTGSAGVGGNTSGGATQAPIKQTDAKTFMKGKNPQSDIQRVACLAYYLNHARDTAAFKTADVTKLNTEARGPDFNTTRAIDNASRATCGYCHRSARVRNSYRPSVKRL